MFENWFAKNDSIFYYDFETTGLNQYHDKIIEYTFLTEDKNMISSLVNPEIKIPPKVISITKITDEMLVDKPLMWQSLPKITKFIESGTGTKFLIAHNNDNFDKIFLQNNLKKYDYNCKNYSWKFIDTLLLAKKILPNISSYSLKSLCKHFNIKVDGSHRSTADTKMVRKLYHALCKELIKKLGTNYEELISNPALIYNYLYE